MLIMPSNQGSMKNAYAQVYAQATELTPGTSRIITAKMDLSEDKPKLIEKKIVYKAPGPKCNGTVEAQDFYDGDAKLTFTCYEPDDHMSSVMGVDLKTDEVINYTPKPHTFNEPEGIFPDGNYTLVESDRQTDWLGGRRGPWNIDIWKLKLDRTVKDFVRLTHF